MSKAYYGCARPMPGGAGPDSRRNPSFAGENCGSGRLRCPQSKRPEARFAQLVLIASSERPAPIEGPQVGMERRALSVLSNRRRSREATFPQEISENLSICTKFGPTADVLGCGCAYSICNSRSDCDP